MDKVAEYGPIFRFRLPGTEMVMVASQELVHELYDESRFDKKVHGALQGVRDFAGDGLFTATPRSRNQIRNSTQSSSVDRG
ncbi:hypothetical protein EAH68_08280 [Corynebacterium hylobatis]|uniref:Cytochrome P450 n=2 Tax=Corynebacterium hylobatis TaxID=1859290 RepID=A0A430HYG3_9CORY|nr:hypothetical protein EAH68_08280 [Corynebacterium hylobatis]